VATKALSPGINDPTTAIHALGHCSALLYELAWHTDRDQRRAVADQLARLRGTATAQDFDAVEHARPAQLADQAEQALSGCWRPGRRTS